MKKIIFILLVNISLLSCSNTHYGFTKTEWNQLSKEEQDIIIEDSNEMLANSKRIKQNNDDNFSIMDRAGKY